MATREVEEQEQHAFLDASKAGNWTNVRTQLDSRPELLTANPRDLDRLTPLHHILLKDTDTGGRFSGVASAPFLRWQARTPALTCSPPVTVLMASRCLRTVQPLEA